MEFFKTKVQREWFMLSPQTVACWQMSCQSNLLKAYIVFRISSLKVPMSMDRPWSLVLNLIFIFLIVKECVSHIGQGIQE